jgi:ribosomal protein L7/L12
MTDYMDRIDARVLETIRLHLREGSKIRAIKTFVEMTGGTVDEGKQVVEAIMEGMSAEEEVESEELISFEWEGLAGEEKQEIMVLLGRGEKIAAIKRYREMTGLGLKEAKEWIDRLEDSATPPPVPEGPPPISEGEWTNEVIELLRRNEKIHAIKLFRERTGLGLKEAKEKVDKLELALRHLPPGQRLKIKMELPPSVDPPPIIQTLDRPPPMPGDYGIQFSDPNNLQPLPVKRPKTKPVAPPPPPPPIKDPRAEAVDALHSEITFLMRTGQKKKAIARYAETMKVSEKAAKDEIKRIVNASPFGKNKKEGCFIATACCGEMSPEVERLRRFRDEQLLPRRAGRAFITLYYLLSPPLAKVIAAREPLRELSRKTLIGPLFRTVDRYFP